MKENIDDFLREYEGSKKNDYTKDGNKTIKDKFKEIWSDYISHNPFNHKSKLYLIKANKYDSADLFWKLLCDRNDKIKTARAEVKEEFENDYKGDIPFNILQLLTLSKELDNQDIEKSKYLEKIHSLENDILVLKNEIRKLETTVSENGDEIKNLNKEIDEQKKLREIDARNESQKTLEKYQKIANELHSGFTQFKEANDMEMSLDLGEVLRDILTDVYEILSKNEIKLGV